MNYNFIKTAVDGHQFKLTLARPQKRNAFTPTMVNEIAHALEEAESDTNIRIIIIDAEGPVFCAGMDLKAFQNPENDEQNPQIENKDISLGAVFRNLNKPTIALLEGDVIAGGFLIILECTFVFAKEQVKFNLPEVKIGIFPFQVLESLLKVMPQNKALQLCIEGQAFDTQRAIELGIVYDFLDDLKIKNLIESLESNAPLATKSGFQALKALPQIQEKERFNFLLEELAKLRNSADAKEGIAAMFEKRKPVWKGR